MQSANIPEGDRNPRGYTEEEILHELRGLRGTRKVSFRYEHLDKDMKRIKDLDNVIGGSVQMSYTSSIKRTATFTMRGDGEIDFLHDYIKPWFRLHMPPRMSGETQQFVPVWENSFASPDLGPASQGSLNSTGSEVEYVSGTLEFVDSPLYRSQNVLQLGAKSPGTGGYFVTPTLDLVGEVRRWNGLMYFEQGANHQNVWRDELGEFFGGWGSDNTKCGFAVNGRWNQVFLSGTDMGSALYNNLINKWVRVEIDFDYIQTRVFYRFYWSNPHSGSVPDYEHDVAMPPGTPKIHGFEVEKSTDDGTFPNAAMYLSRCSLGHIETVPTRPLPTENDWVEWPLGVFMMSTPTQTSSNGVVIREIEAYDRSKLFLDDKLEERMVIQKGALYTDVMKGLLENRYPDIDIPYLIEPSTYVCGRTRDFEVGTEIKEVLDRIAESINYHTMQVDENGRVVYRPYVSPEVRTPEFDYSDNEISIMHDDVSSEFDIYEVANVWIVSLSETEGDPIYVKLENHDPSNPFSIPRRGRRIVDFREQEEGVDANTIMSKAKRIQFEANRVYETIEFSTLSNPLHSTNDCFTINFGDLNIRNKYTETGWEMELSAGSEMSHSARRNVNLDPELFDGFIDDELVVNGSLTAGNIAWGRVLVPISKVNVPQSVMVTGLDLKGTGRVDVFVTADTTVPENVKAVCSQDETPTGFRIWVYRTTSSDTWVNWLALRKV